MLSTDGSIVMILSLALGALPGKIIDLDTQFERFGMSRAPEKIGRLFTLDMRLNLCLIDILWLDPIPKIDA